MRLEEVEASGTEQRGQAEGLSEAAADHRQLAEKLRELQDQLDRIEATLTSSDIVQAQSELRQSQEVVEVERNRLEEQRRELLRENLELTARCEQALEKANKALQTNDSLFRQVAIGVGAEAVKILFGAVGQLAANKPDLGEKWVDSRVHMGQAVEAANRHVERLEKAKEELLETRKLLEVERDD